MLATVDKWKEYLYYNVGFDLRILRRAQKGFPNFIRSAIFAPRVVAQTVAKTYFRLMYFTHGANKTYNFILTRYMFVQQTEGRSIANDRIAIKETRQDVDNDVDFPLFTRDLPPTLTRLIQHLWKLY